MLVELDESTYGEFRDIDTAKATARLRAAGIDEGLVWQRSDCRDKVFVEAPAGTPTALIEKAVGVGYS